MENGEVDGKGVDQLDKQFVEKRIGAPLAAVQMLLQRDKVVWTRGLLAFPQVPAITVFFVFGRLHPFYPGLWAPGKGPECLRVR
jgi:hypothetical protein